MPSSDEEYLPPSDPRAKKQVYNEWKKRGGGERREQRRAQRDSADTVRRHARLAQLRAAKARYIQRRRLHAASLANRAKLVLCDQGQSHIHSIALNPCYQQ